MLQSTFQRLVCGVSADQEAKLWRRGVVTWKDLERHRSRQGELFEESEGGRNGSSFATLRDALLAEDANYFSQALERRDHYRIALTFPRRILFLDIETTGLSRYYDYITLIGWCYQRRYYAIVRGQDTAALHAALADALIIVTFNGSIFDLPFLQKEFPDLPRPPVHLDLRFLAKRVGLSGGQKVLEEKLGFERPVRVRNVKGEAAPLLWHKYRRGDTSALKLLIEYNHCDIEGMKFILDHVVTRLTASPPVPEAIRKKIPHFAVRTKLVWTDGETKTPASCVRIRLEPYKGELGPQVTLGALSVGSDQGLLRVVGIDLTGAEVRPSGWCSLNGDQAVTKMLGTDEDIVVATLAARPHIVSIDSPLSLPHGRTSVLDDDPGRDEYGIMRHCERLLKKRGINVYPALIPSMQRLTARGIRLAARFRTLGLPVIESYPGAAQDIMGIPRKRASLEMLKEGLAEFGIHGPYLNADLTHDELDAVTAAVVGVFFWSGRFESLGSEEEEALIIPDLKTDPCLWTERTVIGISGPIAAGKTTVARHLETLGFTYARYSMVLEEMLREQGMSASRQDLQIFGEEVHRRHGQRWLGRKLLASLGGAVKVVVDGLRFPDDHAFLAEAFGPAFRHIHVDAPRTIRKIRFETRENSDNNFLDAEGHPVEQQVPTLCDLAHSRVRNDSDFDSLSTQIAEYAARVPVEA